jgi:hypothetical protein
VSDETNDPNTFRIVGKVLMSVGFGLGAMGVAFYFRATDVGLTMLGASAGLLIAGAVLARGARESLRRKNLGLGEGEARYYTSEHARRDRARVEEE